MSRFIEALGERIGLALTKKQREEQQTYRQLDEKLKKELIADLYLHSNACHSEIDFALGRRHVSPHDSTESPIQFAKSAHDSSKAL